MSLVIKLAQQKVNEIMENSPPNSPYSKMPFDNVDIKIPEGLGLKSASATYDRSSGRISSMYLVLESPVDAAQFSDYIKRNIKKATWRRRGTKTEGFIDIMSKETLLITVESDSYLNSSYIVLTPEAFPYVDKILKFLGQ